MAEKPAQAAGAASVQQRIWTVIRARHALGKRITKPDVAFDLKASEGSVRVYMDALVGGGYLKAAEKRPRSKHSTQFVYATYKLARDVGLVAPRVWRRGEPATRGLCREQMWRTVKILREFNARDLSLAASTPDCAVTVECAQQYTAALCRAGYLMVSRPATRGPGSSLVRYRFVPSKNTGPLPPRVRGRDVFDLNLNIYVLRRPGKK